MPKNFLSTIRRKSLRGKAQPDGYFLIVLERVAVVPFHLRF